MSSSRHWPKVAAREKKLNPDPAQWKSPATEGRALKRHALSANTRENETLFHPWTIFLRSARAKMLGQARRKGGLLPVAAKGLAIFSKRGGGRGAIGPASGSPNAPGGSLLCTIVNCVLGVSSSANIRNSWKLALFGRGPCEMWIWTFKGGGVQSPKQGWRPFRSAADNRT